MAPLPESREAPGAGSCEERGAGADSSLHVKFCRSPGDVRSEGLKQWVPSKQAGPPVPLITVFLLYRFIPKKTALSSQVALVREPLCS